MRIAYFNIHLNSAKLMIKLMTQRKKTKTLSFRLELDKVDEIISICKERRIDVSDFLREATLHYLEEIKLNKLSINQRVQELETTIQKHTDEISKLHGKTEELTKHVNDIRGEITNLHSELTKKISETVTDFTKRVDETNGKIIEMEEKLSKDEKMLKFIYNILKRNAEERCTSCKYFKMDECTNKHMKDRWRSKYDCLFCPYYKP